jgi:uncharacterized SAM-binding protein YcdF (DUF218 family)
MRKNRMSAAFFLFQIVFTTGIVYGAGFLVFLFSLPQPSDIDPDAINAEAIVVLTGEGQRLAPAVDLLRRGAGRRLLISGVNPDIDKEELDTLLDGGAAFNCCADLGFDAIDTHGNAVETRQWAIEHGYESLIVVTGYEHMPRALLEFLSEMPEITLIPYPVRQTKEIGLADGSLTLINAEYAKYLASWLRLNLSARPGAAT